MHAPKAQPGLGGIVFPGLIVFRKKKGLQLKRTRLTRKSQSWPDASIGRSAYGLSFRGA